MRFQFPWAFVLLAVIPLAIWWGNRRKAGAAIRFSSVQNAREAGRSWRARMVHLPMAVRALALVLLVVGLARPQQGKEEIRDVSEGVAIEMVVDRSGSMSQELVYAGERLNRLEAVKRIFRDFVLGNGKDLQGRPNDLIGMVVFARYADTTCPLTLSHGALDRFIDSIQLVTRKNEDGTAIGDGLALAAARLKTVEESLKSEEKQRLPATYSVTSDEQWDTDASAASTSSTAFGAFAADIAPDYHIKSKVIILLTDGQNNAGKRSPQEAARLAREWGIKIYAIGIGGRESFATIQTPLGAYKVPAGPGVDEQMLKAVAEETGGAYWLAESADKLHDVYKEIDKLERTEIESVRYMDYSEKFYPFVLAALVALLFEQVLRNTLLRRIP